MHILSAESAKTFYILRTVSWNPLIIFTLLWIQLHLLQHTICVVSADRIIHLKHYKYINKSLSSLIFGRLDQWKFLQLCLTLIGMRGDTFVSLYFLNQILSAEFLSKISKLFWRWKSIGFIWLPSSLSLIKNVPRWC